MTFSSNNALQLNQLPLTLNFPKTYDEFLPIMTLLYKRIVASMNTKEGSLYSLEELGNFNQYFTLNDPLTFRNVYRKVFDVVDENGGPIPAGATVNFAHNITGIVSCTHIYGTATNSDVPVHYLPLPYASSTAGKVVELYATPTEIFVINGATQSALTQCYVVLEYVKEA